MSEVTPRDREEKLLAAIAEGATGELPTPRNRKEKLLKEIYDNGGGGGGGGGESTIAWRPKVDANGNISWERTVSTVKPATQNIKGPQGEKGETGEKGEIGLSITSATFNSSGKLVIELSDGSFLPPVTMPSASVDVSRAEGNCLEQKADGMFVAKTDISNLVEKEIGKGLSSNDYTDEDKKNISDNKDAIDKLNGDDSIVGSVAYQIADALGKLNKLSKKIVEVLPSADVADANTIYMVKEGGGNYAMYTVVTLADGSKSLASMGSTDIDLTDYLKTENAKITYLALADVKKDVLALLDSTTENGIVYLTYNGSKILTKSQIETLLEDYATKQYVGDEVDKKVDKTSITKTLDATKTDEQVPSAKAVFDELENKIDKEYGTSHKGEVLVVGEDGKVTAKAFDVIDDSDTESTTTTLSAKKIMDKVPFEFGITDDGQYGYIKDGADTVTPFKSGDGCEIVEISDAIKGINTIRFPRPNPIGFYYVVDSASYPAMYYSTDMKNVLHLRKGSATYTGGRYTMPSTATEVVKSVTDTELTIHYSNGAPNGKLYCFYDESRPSIESEGATILRGTMVGGTNNIFTTEKTCKEITITFGFSKVKFVVKVNGEDKTSLLNNYGGMDNDHGMSSATISGDFPVGTEISIQTKASENAGYVICY